MKIRPVLRCHVPAYPAIAVAALAAASAVAAEKPVPLAGKPAPPKTTQSEPKPQVRLGKIAAPLLPQHGVDGATVLWSNTTFVSTAVLADKLGVRVIHPAIKSDWTLEFDSRRVVLSPAKLEALANGKPVRLPARPFMQGRTLYVPVRAVGEALGLTIGQRGPDTALSTPRGRKMLILRAAPVDKSEPAAPQPLQGTPAPPPLPKR
jgi:hypothetical protein